MLLARGWGVLEHALVSRCLQDCQFCCGLTKLLWWLEAAADKNPWVASVLLVTFSHACRH